MLRTASLLALLAIPSLAVFKPVASPPAAAATTSPEDQMENNEQSGPPQEDKEGGDPVVHAHSARKRGIPQGALHCYLGYIPTKRTGRSCHTDTEPREVDKRRNLDARGD